MLLNECSGCCRQYIAVLLFVVNDSTKNRSNPLSYRPAFPPHILVPASGCIEKNLIEILPKSMSKEEMVSEFHAANNSEFKYIEHYQKDKSEIITDDLNLPFGSIRVKTKGSDGGHNGLKDIQEKLNTTKYNRYRFGISDTFSKGRQVDYVLGEWTTEELDQLKERLDKSIALIKSFGLAGINNTMNTFNGK